MLNAIKAFVEKQILQPADAGKPAQEHALRLATAALLIEVMRLDETEHEQEQQAVLRALEQKFGLDGEELSALLGLAREELEEATDYYQFTSLIKQHFNAARRLALVEQLWRVAAADGHIDKYEEHLVRRIAELLYVPHSEFIRARHRALDQS
jgi:uncharacterized tellurite resistance protein B-like protein